ncbi:GNAT family N-acetyltransferase [Streptacidiphilus melanogenes]|uniref:GNAT family N-acetyltransferase n=1 Tax=Streptacidiphilus melanogenes TaxID=411235 RepID=UPI0005AA14FB|nr:GNAT family N-acetyltransferase [Streptacidiphilus melanogenes]
MNYTIRAYTPADENSWLRCRVLAFLDTAFYDSVVPAKPDIAAPGLELVALDGAGAVVAILDAGIEGELATIDTIAVHPDHRRRGLGRQLLERAREWARAAGASTLDAWTRDDVDTLAWYRSSGFAESDHYLHVYAFHYTDPAEPRRAVAEARPGLRPILVFAHAPLADEQRLRGEFSRVHVDRRFSMPV